MAIIRYTKDATIRYAYLNIFPDQFKTEKEKQDESWIKNTMDYFANKAYAEYVKNRDTFVKNYDLVKGILRMEDFYQEPQVKSFTDMLTTDLQLPAYVKHYSIITTPINELVGEISKRPDTFRVKAFDDDSKAEELEFKTKILQDYVVNKAKERIVEDLAMKGEDPSKIDPEELNQMTMQDVQDQLDDYTSVAEKWANHVLTCQKAEFNLKEKSEDAFRDMLISAREFYHIYEDNSKLGFNIEVANPKNTWFLTTPDRKYISDTTGRAQGAYAAGTVQVMELSEIIEAIPDLTKDEIDHLRSSLQDYGLINVRESNLGNPDAIPGQDSVQYDTYDPAVLQTRMIIESEMKENNDGLKDFLGLTSNVSSFGYKYVVVRSYWISKKKIGKLIYEDELGNEQSVLVDENYKSGTIPTQKSLEWGWINQWYQGIKIGPDIYHIKPYKLLNYCPIIGLTHEVKNTEAKSLVDLMKPFQVLYNVCMNQLYKLLEKEVGKVYLTSIRHIPIPKDGDAQDALDIWEMEARNRGVMFIDDSPENLKSPSSFNQFRDIDLTRTQEIQSRYNLAMQLKNECWELIGMSKQRLGSISASESATGTNTAIQQSYSQTEPLFVAHEYVMGQLYQAIIDAALYTESKKPQSTLSYITNTGESAFVQVNGSDLRFRDLKVFLTNRPEDQQMFQEIRGLSQAVIQNGGSLYDIIELYSTKSIRQMKKVFKTLKERQEQMQNQKQQMEQQQMEQQQQQAQAQLQQAAQLQQEKQAHDDYQRELDRLSKEKIAIIQAAGFGKVESEDINQNAIPDVLEMGKLSHEQEKAAKDYQLKMADIASKSKQAADKMAIEREKLQVARENQANDLAVAKENAKGRANKKTK
ncbi:MAG: hypothetical protein EB127_03065 [Alphaproteobacteria bacterium]|nr:hypothetical protein [Alphaproteobacteria bacterium]